MTGKKNPTKRPVALPRLYKSIDEFCVAHGLELNVPIADLLAAVQAEWFKEAQK